MANFNVVDTLPVDHTDAIVATATASGAGDFFSIGTSEAGTATVAPMRVPVTDTCAVGCSDAVQRALVSPSDTVGVGVIEAPSIAAAVSATGASLPIGVSEQLTQLKTVADSFTVGLDDSTTPTIFFSAVQNYNVVDTLTAGLIEDSALSTGVTSAFDSIPLGQTDALVAIMTFAGYGEVITLGISEATPTVTVGSGQINKSVFETITLGADDTTQAIVTDVTNTLVIKSVSDTLGLGMADVAVLSYQIYTATESLALGLAEPVVQDLAFGLFQTITVGFNDPFPTVDSGAIVNKSVADSLTIGQSATATVTRYAWNLSDSLSVVSIDAPPTVLAVVPVTDNIAVGSSELAALVPLIATTDLVAIGLVEIGVPIINFPVVESLTVGLTEATANVIIVTLIPSVTDSLRLGVVETSPFPLPVYSTVDTAPIGTAETAALVSAVWSLDDQLAGGLSEAAAIVSASWSLDDTLAVGLDESSPVIGVGVADELAVVLDDIGAQQDAALITKSVSDVVALVGMDSADYGETQLYAFQSDLCSLGLSEDFFEAIELVVWIGGDALDHANKYTMSPTQFTIDPALVW